jgi:GNAT superfamily N-acetyltransferase
MVNMAADNVCRRPWRRHSRLTAAQAPVKMIAKPVGQNRGTTAMIDDWFSAIELPLTWQQFRQLPQNPAYKYEYFDGRGWLSPRPKSYHAVLDLRTFTSPIADTATDDKVVVRPLQDADWQQLPGLFAAAFHRVQPFASLTDGERLAAAEDCLGHTRGSGEGPLVCEACLVATRDGTLVGATLITLPPDDASKHAAGLPHLTWIFVAPFHARQGVGMALLDMAVRALLRLGYKELASTFLVGNEASMLWHWRAGFKLPEQPWSMRVSRKEAQAGDVQSRPAGT